ncbi:GIY-YIG nuclease family protein [Alkalihalobacillus sp. CinArs1]|uniref:GIY-YIG nuclease family protein n=1 Tax=Alkalihalobacillus sp. CinArs1 TaxID=2995314 RepID=UPI0022DD6837|nr:GIY-YIG nuclease family protein [Alkalihalobacillus sp. CinArs1]
MNKQLTNMITGLMAIYFIYHLIIAGLNAVWNWFLSLLNFIGIWVHNHIEIILICLVIITIVPIILKLIFRVENKPTSTYTEQPGNESIQLSEEEKQKASFERWHHIKQDPTSNQTQQMIEVMNEMLKSNRHRKENEGIYNNLLNMNGLGYVYFVKTPDGTTKIGLTKKDPFKRITQIFGGVNTSYNVEVIHLIRTNHPEKTERKFHKYFETKRYINLNDPTEKSEFFHLDRDDWRWIRRQSTNALARAK